MASVGDRVHIHGRTVDAPDRVGEIIEVRGEDGAPPYVVRFGGGQETVLYPGPDTLIESSAGERSGG